MGNPIVSKLHYEINMWVCYKKKGIPINIGMSFTLLH